MTRCSATRKNGEPCQAHAVHGYDKCAAHLGRCRALPNNTNAQKHGAYTSSLPETQEQPIDSQDTLREHCHALSVAIHELKSYIDQQTLSTDQYISLLNLYGNLVSRLARLINVISSLHTQDPWSDVLKQAYDQASQILQIDI